MSQLSIHEHSPLKTLNNVGNVDDICVLVDPLRITNSNGRSSRDTGLPIQVYFIRTQPDGKPGIDGLISMLADKGYTIAGVNSNENQFKAGIVIISINPFTKDSNSNTVDKIVDSVLGYLKEGHKIYLKKIAYKAIAQRAVTSDYFRERKVPEASLLDDGK